MRKRLDASSISELEMSRRNLQANGLVRALQAFTDSSEDNVSAHAAPHIEHAIAEAIAFPGGPASVKYYPG